MSNEVVMNFHDDILRDVLKDLDIDQLRELLKLSISKEQFEQSRVIKLEMDSRTG